MQRRLFTQSQKARILCASQFKCQSCGIHLNWSNFHADHVIPFSKGGETVLSNASALCGTCNLSKGNKMGMKLLNWQQKALKDFKETTKKDFVVVAGTGCGKTSLGVACAKEMLARRFDSVVIIVTPSRSTKDSWRKTVDKFKLSVASKIQEIASDISVIITTYQGAKTTLQAVDDYLKGKKVTFIFDEFHHLEMTGEWAKPFLEFDENSILKRIFLSGTPWHESGDLIKWIEYIDTPYGNVVKANVSHSYGENVNAEDGDKNTVEIRFEQRKIKVIQKTTDISTGSENTIDLISDETNRSDSITPFVRFGGLKVNAYDDLLTTRTDLIKIIDEAVLCLNQKRKTLSNAAGIVFVSGKKEGEAIQVLFKNRHDIDAVFVFSDDPNSSREIEAFEKSHDEWIIAVDMISEGTDIPRLKVGVDLSFKITLLSIIQRWGRLLRMLRTKHGDPLGSQVEAVLFFINHAQLVYVAKEIENDVKKFKQEKRELSPLEKADQKYFKEVVGSEIENKSTIYKGQEIQLDVSDLADWLRLSNHHGFSNSVDFKSAVYGAQLLIQENKIPEGYISYKSQSDVSALENKEKTPAQLKETALKALDAQRAKVHAFFDNDYARAGSTFNRWANIDGWERRNKSLIEVLHHTALWAEFAENLGITDGEKLDD
jgi:superfamily II DNA or RNA helicase